MTLIKRTLRQLNNKNTYIVLSCALLVSMLFINIVHRRRISEDSVDTIEKLHTHLDSSLNQESLDSLSSKKTYDEVDKWFREIEDNMKLSALKNVEYNSIQRYKYIFGNTSSLNLRILPIYLNKKTALEIRAINKNGELLRISPFTNYEVERSSSSILINNSERRYYLDQINLYTKIRINTLEDQFDRLNTEIQDTIADCREELSSQNPTSVTATEFQVNRRASCKDKVDVFSLIIEEQKTESEVLNSPLLSNMESDIIDQITIENTIESYFNLSDALEKYREEGLLSDSYIDNYKNILKIGEYTTSQKSFMQSCNSFELFYYNSSSSDTSPQTSYSTCR